MDKMMRTEPLVVAKTVFDRHCHVCGTSLKTINMRDGTAKHCPACRQGVVVATIVESAK